MPDTIPQGSPESQVLETLVEIMKSANTPDVWQAQSILLRRLALQGDVVGSRVPAPLNITEVGGYLNLLETLEQPELRGQALAGILGVAGPNPPLGWVTAVPPLAMVTVANDRPEGAAQATMPLSIAIRSDFLEAFQGAMASLHAQGGTLPLISAALPLTGSQSPMPDDVLPYLGRVLQVVPSAALQDASTDPIVLARPQGTTDPLEITSRVLAPGAEPVAAANWDALECDDTACALVPAANEQLIPVAPILASAGFYPADPLAEPGNNSEHEWSRLTNVTGLIAGVTQLGDELSLLYDQATIGGSVFANRLHWTWNGTAFAP